MKILIYESCSRKPQTKKKLFTDLKKIKNLRHYNEYLNIFNQIKYNVFN